MCQGRAPSAEPARHGAGTTNRRLSTRGRSCPWVYGRLHIVLSPRQRLFGSQHESGRPKAGHTLIWEITCLHTFHNLPHIIEHLHASGIKMDLDQVSVPGEEELSASGQALSGSASTSSPSMQPSASTVAEAFEKRIRQQREEQQAKAAGPYAAFDADHEKRQEFRRMIDPGILRPNARPQALESLRVLTIVSDDL